MLKKTHTTTEENYRKLATEQGMFKEIYTTTEIIGNLQHKSEC